MFTTQETLFLGLCKYEPILVMICSFFEARTGITDTFFFN